MRNFKKLLALVLALVMSLSLVAVANAADYTDVAADDDHIEAIEVMSKLGIINGYTDGTFKPEGTLTRAEGAKIVTYMILGDAADKLPTDVSSFSDVPAGKWFAAPIAYLKNEGIVNGRSATVFAPNDTLTGYEFAKMVLVAAGVEGEFTGRAWKLNVASALSQNNMLSNVNPNGDPISRADAAQLGLNGLFVASEIVTENRYALTYTITTQPRSASNAGDHTGDTTVPADTVYFDTYLEAVVGFNVLKNAGDVPWASGTTDGITYNMVAIKEEAVTTYKDSLAEDVFGLTKTEAADGAEDDFGRPATVYACDDWDDTLTYADGASYTLYDKVTPKTLYQTVGGTAADKYDWTVTKNGVAVANGNGAGQTGITGTVAASKSDSNTAYAGTGIGDVTEIYVDTKSDPKTVTVAVTSTYIGTIRKVNAAVDGDKRNVVLAKTGYVFETEDFAKDDVVLYTMAKGEVKTMELAPVVKGTLSKIVNGEEYTIGDTVYKVNANGSTDLAAGNLSKEVSVYVDKRGNIMQDVDDVATAASYIFILGNAASVSNSNYLATGGAENTVEVYGVTADGVAKTYTVESSSSVGLNDYRSKLYTYETTDRGNLTLAEADTTAEGNKIAVGATKVGTDVLNSSTVFVFIEKEADDNFNAKSITVKTGSANIGSTIAENTAYVGAEDGVAKVVFVLAAFSDGSQDTGMLVRLSADSEKATSTSGTSGTKTEYTYKGINNEGDEITVTSSTRLYSGTGYAGKVYRYNEDMTIGSEVKDDTSPLVLKAAQTINKVAGSTIVLVDANTAIDISEADVAYLKDDAELLPGQKVDIVCGTGDDANKASAIWVTDDQKTHELELTVTDITSDYDVSETAFDIVEGADNVLKVTVTKKSGNFTQAAHTLTITQSSDATCSSVTVSDDTTNSITFEITIAAAKAVEGLTELAITAVT